MARLSHAGLGVFCALTLLALTTHAAEHCAVRSDANVWDSNAPCGQTTASASIAADGAAAARVTLTLGVQAPCYVYGGRRADCKAVDFRPSCMTPTGAVLRSADNATARVAGAAAFGSKFTLKQLYGESVRTFPAGKVQISWPVALRDNSDKGLAAAAAALKINAEFATCSTKGCHELYRCGLLLLVLLVLLLLLVVLLLVLVLLELLLPPPLTLTATLFPLVQRGQGGRLRQRHAGRRRRRHRRQEGRLRLRLRERRRRRRSRLRAGQAGGGAGLRAAVRGDGRLALRGF